MPQVRYRPEPDQYRIKDVEMFIKAFAKKAPVDPLDPEKRTPVSGIIYCRARAMVSFETKRLTLRTANRFDMLATGCIAVRSGSGDAPGGGNQSKAVPSGTEEPRAGQDHAAVVGRRRRMRGTYPRD